MWAQRKKKKHSSGKRRSADKWFWFLCIWWSICVGNRNYYFAKQIYQILSGYGAWARTIFKKQKWPGIFNPFSIICNVQVHRMTVNIIRIHLFSYSARCLTACLQDMKLESFSVEYCLKSLLLKPLYIGNFQVLSNANSMKYGNSFGITFTVSRDRCARWILMMWMGSMACYTNTTKTWFDFVDKDGKNRKGRSREWSQESREEEKNNPKPKV